MFGQVIGLIVAVLALLLVLWILVSAIRIIQQGFVGVVKRLGQFHSVRTPGLTLLVPVIDTLTSVDMRETPRTGDRQDVITRDNVSITVNATIFYRVYDAQKALFSVSQYLTAIDQLSRTTLRAVFGSMTLDDVLSQREQINAQLQTQMEKVTEPWGINITRIEIVDIVPPNQILQAMALQKQADQEKRAQILQSEGLMQAAINRAEGEKQAAIRVAEGQRAAAILGAEGARQAAILNAEGRAQAIASVYGAIHAAGVDTNLLAVLQLDTLSKFADSPNAKLVVPVETAALLGATQALRAIFASEPASPT